MILLDVDPGARCRRLRIPREDLVAAGEGGWDLVAAALEVALHRRMAGPAPAPRVVLLDLRRRVSGAEADAVDLLVAGDLPALAWRDALEADLRRIAGVRLTDEGLGPVPDDAVLAALAAGGVVARLFAERPDGVGRVVPRVAPDPFWWQVEALDREVAPAGVVLAVARRAGGRTAASAAFVGTVGESGGAEGLCPRCGRHAVLRPRTPSEVALLAALGSPVPPAGRSRAFAVCETCGALVPWR